MRFAIRAVGPDNRVQMLELDASDATAASRAAVERRLTVLDVRPVAVKVQRRGKTFSLVLFTQELLALLEAGLGLVESLEALGEKESHTDTGALLARLLARMRDGLRFSVAVAAEPASFPPLFGGIVKAAERTSDLPRALTRYIEYQVRVDGVRNRLVSASIYPVILLTVGSAVSMFLLGYVVPKFSAVYQGSGRELPMLSQWLIKWGAAVAGHGMAIMLTMAGTGAALFFWLRRMHRSGELMRLFSRLPGVSQRMHILELARLYLTLGMLLEGGIAVVSALEMVSGAISPGRRAALAAARHAIAQGGSFSESLEQNGLTTPIALRMLRVGERSGQLGLMLTRAALFYDAETTLWIEKFSKTFEPVLMAAIGVVIGAIVVLLYMPIFDLAGTLQ
ncbi:type II secretion system F family protein [Massilia antarctica]|uniref:Type II secretion system F family protein n=1 Tax=Massilia antarctica TaxID=2765360 RepID=A0AA48WCM6_9BURK|nr:type II secretion system F family protein [Massilia antarctica]QPI49273.1 type II secretion system F family protein [Massilia antarctica]